MTQFHFYKKIYCHQEINYNNIIIKKLFCKLIIFLNETTDFCFCFLLFHTFKLQKYLLNKVFEYY